MIIKSLTEVCEGNPSQEEIKKEIGSLFAQVRMRRALEFLNGSFAEIEQNHEHVTHVIMSERDWIILTSFENSPLSRGVIEDKETNDAEKRAGKRGRLWNATAWVRQGHPGITLISPSNQHEYFDEGDWAPRQRKLSDWHRTEDSQ